jgi:cytoskeletal protein RodZ
MSRIHTLLEVSMTKIALSTLFAALTALVVALVAVPAHADEQQRLALNCDLIVASGNPVPPYCRGLQQKTSSPAASPKNAPRAEAPKAVPTATTTTVVTQARPHGQRVEMTVSTTQAGMTLNYATVPTRMKRNTATNDRLVQNDPSSTCAKAHCTNSK